MTLLKDKHIVLGVSGGIAAYKSVELLRLLTKAGADVRILMTENAKWFVGPGTFEALSGRPVCADLFDHHEDAAIGHIKWAEEAHAVVIAPATANIIGKMANGIADDALSTFLLAVTAPVLVCPSMNSNMYVSRPVQRNLSLLEKDGITIVRPDAGELACGTEGPGRLPEPEAVLDRLLARLTPKDFDGKKIVISAGPTRESIDPVRFISNPSSGKMGYAIAGAAEHRGADVTLVSGPVNLPRPWNTKAVYVNTAAEMAQAVFDAMHEADIIIKTAAVADYRPKITAAQKIKKGDPELVLELTKTVDILNELGKHKENRVLVGFAAETEALEKNAGQKLAQKNLDLIVGNLVNIPESGFQTETNKVTFFYKNGHMESLPVMAKDAVAHALLDRIRDIMADRR
ncbi:MAG: bifunctional phosphopantothenoylcysteine decarboxylase/phosphopantothenate--cysteine ligase CoaBC [Desulfobacterales bacterium]